VGQLAETPETPPTPVRNTAAQVARPDRRPGHPHGSIDAPTCDTRILLRASFTETKESHNGHVLIRN